MNLSGWSLRVLLTYVCTITIATAASSQCPASPDASTLSRRYSGEYKNLAYGFDVTVPSKFVGRDVNNPLYQRGFTILFPDPQESISVYADVNSLDWQSISEAATEYTKAFTSQAAKVLSEERKSLLLGERAATQYTSEYFCRDMKTRYSSVTVVSLSADRRFLYTLRWEGKRYERDAGYKILKELMSSWKFHKATS